MSLLLPIRPGHRPTTTEEPPHSQLDQQPSDPAVPALLAETVFALPGVREAPSGISVPGARAFVLGEDRPEPRGGFLIGREVGHVHPGPDHSLHLVLPVPEADQVIEAGWAEPHPLVGTGAAPRGTVMVYAPRTRAEVEIVAQIVRAAVCGPAAR